MIISRLDWDSAFFGFPVGKVDITVHESVTELKSLSESFKDYRLLYLFVDPGNVVINRFLMDQPGLFCTTKVTLGVSVDRESQPNGSGLCRELVSLDDEVRGLAIQAGVFSRFNLDPKIGRQQFEALYTLWISNSIHGDIADFTLGYVGSGQELQSLITGKMDMDFAMIGLFSVGHTVRGRGVGKTLLHAFKQKIIENNICDLSVTTQHDNRAAISFYEKLGFTKTREINIYHHWE